MTTNSESAFTFFAGPANRRSKRLLVVQRGEEEELHRDNIDTNSAKARESFLRQLERRVGAERGSLAGFHSRIIAAADDADQRVEHAARSRHSVGGGNQASLLIGFASDAELFH